jgi:hypothetical protein
MSGAAGCPLPLLPAVAATLDAAGARSIFCNSAFCSASVIVGTASLLRAEACCGLTAGRYTIQIRMRDARYRSFSAAIDLYQPR